MTETFEFFINGSARPAAGGDSFATVNPYTQKQKEWARIFIAPTILTGLTNVAPIAREEVFGPVAVILPFEDDEEALAIANDTDYGLASGVWTSNISRAHRFANELEAGQV